MTISVRILVHNMENCELFIENGSIRKKTRTLRVTFSPKYVLTLGKGMFRVNRNIDLL